MKTIVQVPADVLLVWCGLCKTALVELTEYCERCFFITFDWSQSNSRRHRWSYHSRVTLPQFISKQLKSSLNEGLCFSNKIQLKIHKVGEFYCPCGNRANT